MVHSPQADSAPATTSRACGRRWSSCAPPSRSAPAPVPVAARCARRCSPCSPSSRCTVTRSSARSRSAAAEAGSPAPAPSTRRCSCSPTRDSSTPRRPTAARSTRSPRPGATVVADSDTTAPFEIIRCIRRQRVHRSAEGRRRARAGRGAGGSHRLPGAGAGGGGRARRSASSAVLDPRPGLTRVTSVRRDRERSRTRTPGTPAPGIAEFCASPRWNLAVTWWFELFLPRIGLSRSPSAPARGG